MGSHWSAGSGWDDRAEKRAQDQSLEEDSEVETIKGRRKEGEKERRIGKAKREGVAGRRGWQAASDTAGRGRGSDRWVWSHGNHQSLGGEGSRRWSGWKRSEKQGGGDERHKR